MTKSQYLRALVTAWVAASEAGFDGFAEALWKLIVEERLP